MALVTLLAITTFALISRATASPLPDFAAEEIVAWWAGLQPGYMPGARAEDVRPLEIGASGDRRYEEQLLKRLTEAENTAQEASGTMMPRRSYRSPAEHEKTRQEGAVELVPV